MALRGKYVVLAIVLLAVLLALGNMAYQTWSTRRATAHWGRAAIELIVTAPRVEALRLHSGSMPLDVDATVDSSQARGLLHVRRGLVKDGLYNWDGPYEPPGVPWRYALRFRDGDAEFTLLLDQRCLTVAALENPDNALSIRRSESGGSPLLPFIEEQFSQNAAK